MFTSLCVKHNESKIYHITVELQGNDTIDLNI